MGNAVDLVLETANFYLQPFVEKDFILLYHLWHDKDVVASMGIDPDDPKEDMGKKLVRYTKFFAKFEFSNFAVFTKNTNEFIGSCGFSIFHNPNEDHNPLPKKGIPKWSNEDIEIGYLFYKKYGVKIMQLNLQELLQIGYLRNILI